MRIELNSFLYRFVSLNLEAEGWVDKLLFRLEVEEQELSLEQKFELVFTLVESGGRVGGGSPHPPHINNISKTKFKPSIKGYFYNVFKLQNL